MKLRHIAITALTLLLMTIGQICRSAETDSIIVRGQTITIGDSWQDVSKVLRPSDQLGQDNSWEGSLSKDIATIKYYKIDNVAFSIAFRLSAGGGLQGQVVANILIDDPKIEILEREPICIKPYASPGVLNNYA